MHITGEISSVEPLLPSRFRITHPTPRTTHSEPPRGHRTNRRITIPARSISSRSSGCRRPRRGARSDATRAHSNDPPAPARIIERGLSPRRKTPSSGTLAGCSPSCPPAPGIHRPARTAGSRKTPASKTSDILDERRNGPTKLPARQEVPLTGFVRKRRGTRPRPTSPCPVSTNPATRQSAACALIQPNALPAIRARRIPRRGPGTSM